MLERIVEEARKIDAEGFLATLSRVCSILEQERISGMIDAQVDQRFMRLNREKIILIGDLHGDLSALEQILRKSKFVDSSATLIFLGDYGDRGRESVEVYYLIMSLKIRFPERVVLMRGNHEAPEEMPFYPHDLPDMLQQRFNTENIYAKLKSLFPLLYHAVIANSYLMLHGGAPVKFTLQDLALGDREVIEQILWNDPREISGYVPSARGYGVFFGKDITERALKVTNTHILIRSHEPCNGYKINHDGLVLTIFSCKAPYGNDEAAYLPIEGKMHADKIADALVFI